MHEPLHATTDQLQTLEPMVAQKVHDTKLLQQLHNTDNGEDNDATNHSQGYSKGTNGGE